MRRRKLLAISVALAMSLTFISFVIVSKRIGLLDGWLRHSAAAGNASSTRLLIWLGADANARDADLGTALFYAAGHAHPQVVRVLLCSGADPTLIARDGKTALSCSLYSGKHESLEVDELLIESGGMRDAKHLLGATNSSLTAADHVKILLMHGADPNADSDYFPLMQYAYAGNKKAVSLLIEHGARINAVAADGQTALSEAVAQGNVDVVEYLISHGADTTITLHGKSLIDVAYAKREELVRLGVRPAGLQPYDAIIQFLEQRRNATLGSGDVSK